MTLERDRWRAVVEGYPWIRQTATLEAALEIQLPTPLPASGCADLFEEAQRRMRAALGAVVREMGLDAVFEVWGTGHDVPVFPVAWNRELHARPSDVHDRLDAMRVGSRLDGPFFDATGRAFLTRLEGSFRRSPGHDSLIAAHLPRGIATPEPQEEHE